jgi:hypothetical protein
MPKIKAASGNSSFKEKAKICPVLRQHLGQRTVLGVAIPVLSAHIDSMKSGDEVRGLTERQIEVAFGELSAKFGKSDYHSTYLHRGLARFLESSGNRYKIRRRLLFGASVTELERLRRDLVESLRTAYEKRQAVIRKLMDTCSLRASK